MRPRFAVKSRTVEVLRIEPIPAHDPNGQPVVSREAKGKPDGKQIFGQQIAMVAAGGRRAPAEQANARSGGIGRSPRHETWRLGGVSGLVAAPAPARFVADPVAARREMTRLAMICRAGRNLHHGIARKARQSVFPPAGEIDESHVSRQSGGRFSSSENGPIPASRPCRSCRLQWKSTI